MKLTKEQLALIDTLMYCEGITSVTNDSTTLEDHLDNLFFTNSEGTIDRTNFIASNDQLCYPDDLQQVVEAILNDPELCKLKVVATSETYKADKNLENTSGALSLCLYDESTSDIVVLYAGDYYSNVVDGIQEFLLNI